MNNHDLIRAFIIAIVALCLPYCCERPSKIKTYDAGISLEVQKDILRADIYRRLNVLGSVTMQEAEKAPTARKIQAVSASEAVSQ